MEDERKFPVFREEVAKAISASPAWPAAFEPGASLIAAEAALTRLRQLGAFHVDALTAIKEQEKE